MTTLSKTGITTGNTIQAGHVTQSIDAFTGLTAYNITLSGSLTLTGSVRSQNGFTGSLLGTSSWAVNAISSSHAALSISSSYAISSSRATNAIFADSVYITSSLSVFPLAISLFNNTASDNATFRFDNDDLKYQPSNNTLYVTNIQGTASLAATASYTLNSSTSDYSLGVRGIAVPSGSAPAQAIFNFIAGSSQTDNSPIPTAVINLPALAGKTLGQDCFITIGVSGSIINDLVTIVGLTGFNLTFISQNANTYFHYHIMYF